MFKVWSHFTFLCDPLCSFFFFFFFNDTATTEIYTLSLHDALPISPQGNRRSRALGGLQLGDAQGEPLHAQVRSEEHTSELQSRLHLVCRLLLEKKKKNQNTTFYGRTQKQKFNKHHPLHTQSRKNRP